MSGPQWRIVFSEPYSDEAVARARTVGDIRTLASCDEAALLEAVADCDALVVRTASQVTRRVIESAPRLRVIGRGGVGLDNINLDAARERNITVVYTPCAATDAVADLTFALLLGLVWKLRDHDAAVRGGRFGEARIHASPRELSGQTLGIIGMGRIGRTVARRAINGFLMEVIYIDIVDVGELDFPARRTNPEELFAQSDVVSLHVPLTAQTRKMIDHDELKMFKTGALLVNTSRGAVVNAGAVADALTCGKLAGAGFDVFDPEPPPPGHPILSAPNTLFSPHIGARSPRAQKNMNSVIEDVILVLEGAKPRWQWND